MTPANPVKSRSRPITRLGYVPLCDCAPIAVARERGLFERHGLNVKLSREIGWSTVRDKIYYGELDATQSIAGIALELGMGFRELRRPVAIPMILNLLGNAITLSNSLKPENIGQGEKLQNHLRNSWKKDRPLTLAATHRYSSHHILLHGWLKRNGLNPSEHVEIVFLPPPLMPRQLKAGHIDGFCVGEPWNSVAIHEGTGWCPATSNDLSHGHPEKVLLISEGFEKHRRDDVLALVAALLEACRMCQDPEFREELISILAMKAYTGASEEILRNSLGTCFDTGNGRQNGKQIHIFHGESVNCPTVEKASWVLAGLRSIGSLPEITCGSLSRIYREDLFHAATHQLQNA